MGCTITLPKGSGSSPDNHLGASSAALVVGHNDQDWAEIIKKIRSGTRCVPLGLATRVGGAGAGSTLPLFPRAK